MLRLIVLGVMFLILVRINKGAKDAIKTRHRQTKAAAEDLHLTGQND